MHAVQETIYFSKESTEDKTLVGSLSLPLLGPQRIASRVRENPTRMKTKEQREEIQHAAFTIIWAICLFEELETFILSEQLRPDATLLCLPGNVLYRVSSVYCVTVGAALPFVLTVLC